MVLYVRTLRISLWKSGTIALLVLLFWFNAIFLLMANSLNRNARLRQENQLLSMQQRRYESLKTAIEEARQARHDMRHQLNQVSALAESGNLDGVKAYLAKAVARIPNLDMHFCENRAADSVVGYYCALAKREDIPFRAQLDLPESLPVDEIDMCLVLSNLLENALEASLRTAPDRLQINVTAYLHAERLLLIEIQNAYDGETKEKDGVFRSSKRKGPGVGIRSVRHIAEKPAARARLPIRTARSPRRSCSAPRRKPRRNNMQIREYTAYSADEILRLYAAVGWTAYTKDAQALEQGFRNSLLVLAAYENDALRGILRAVGDGATIVFIQDILVHPDHQRQGIGTALMRALLHRYANVRQIELMTDDTPETASFYRSLGFAPLSELGCRGFMRA